MPIRPLDWLKRGTGKRSNFRRSKVEERRVAGELGGRRAIMSGAARISAHSTETEGADIKVRRGVANSVGEDGLRLHLEHKRTGAPVLRVQREWFAKVNASSHRTASSPAVAFLLETLSGTARDWIGLPSEAFYACFDADKWGGVVPVHPHTRLNVEGQSISLRAGWLEDLAAQRFKSRGGQELYPAFVLNFEGARNMPMQWVFVTLATFNHLRGDS